ncbi:MAG TPA: hypothetical protein VJI68_02220 [Candidatus Nanoarchaeia archaeon]|nr:hypothetical protein [Candidatus Nanoarchaeia archaeon]
MDKEILLRYLGGKEREKDLSSLDSQVVAILNGESAEVLLQNSSEILDLLDSLAKRGVTLVSDERKSTVLGLAYVAEHRAGEFLLQRGKMIINILDDAEYEAPETCDTFPNKVYDPNWWTNEKMRKTHEDNKRIAAEKYWKEIRAPIEDTSISFFVKRIDGLVGKLIENKSRYPKEAAIIAQSHLARLYDLIRSSSLRINVHPFEEKQLDAMDSLLEKYAENLLGHGAPTSVSQTNAYAVLTQTVDLIRTYQGFLGGKISEIERDAQFSRLVESAEEISKYAGEAVDILNLMRADVRLGFETLGIKVEDGFVSLENEVRDGFKKSYTLQGLSLKGMQALGTLVNHYGTLQTGGSSPEYLSRFSFTRQFGNLLREG